jgi:hypothetical protein
MRFKSRTIIAALFAVLALGAVTAATASATESLPEWRGGKGVKFTGTGGPMLFSGPGGSLECRGGSSATGEISGSKTLANVLVTFKGCPEAETSMCHFKEIWETKPLGGTLGYVNKATKNVGLLLAPASGPVIECKNGDFIGSVIGKITPVNRLQKEFTLTYVETGNVQALTKFEGEEATHTLEWSSPPAKAERVGIEGEMKLTFANAVEIEE